MLVEKIKNDLVPFVNHLIQQLDKMGFIADLCEIDHVCYRVDSVERYQTYKRELDQIGELLSEEHINGRPISTYRLYKPLAVTHSFEIPLFELPSPKPGRHYEEGFEHIEAVVRKPLETFMAKHHQISFDTSNLNAANNRDISLKVDGGVVKFHEASLEWIIALENSIKTGA